MLVTRWPATWPRLELSLLPGVGTEEASQFAHLHNCCETHN